MTPPSPVRVILLRHGESEANAANRFTGSADPALTPLGREQAAMVANRLLDLGFRPARVFRSTLRRCADTVAIVTAVMGAPDVPITADPALNERDYGALTGLNKTEAAERYGAEQVLRWRRSYSAAPPEGESLRDTAARVLAFHVRSMLPAAMRGGTTLVVAHGNSLRALVMALDGLDETQIERFDIPTGGAILYTFDPTTAIVDRALLQ
jgi:2,3-bisphosphoglycerate-dependent phosphoglycerate mutase